MNTQHSPVEYYVPQPSWWPFIGAVGLFLCALGAGQWVHGGSPVFLVAGAAVVLTMVFGWTGQVVHESQSGHYNAQVDRSYRWGMAWFIFSEVMFFGAFFFVLFYTRLFVVPWLGGEGDKASTAILWPGFQADWPTNGPGALGGAFAPMEPWGIPAINTIILLTSAAAVTWAHWGLRAGQHRRVIVGLALAIALGGLFLGLQGYEYLRAYTVHNLTLGTGIYGSTFFMLTGFHGLHVTIGAVLLSVMLVRAIAGHFTPSDHFGFEAAAWYWHFVDAVWLGLFVFVYWLI
jgi:cytochrome c oxidase subunit 3